MQNPSGMTASLKEASKPDPFLPEPTVAEMIRPKGYSWQLSNAKRQKIHFREQNFDGCDMLQIGCVVYVCFT